jgi:hypothetical protein
VRLRHCATKAFLSRLLVVAMADILEDNIDFIKKCIDDKKSYSEIAESLQQQFNVRGLSMASVKKFVLKFGLRKSLSKHELCAKVKVATGEVSYVTSCEYYCYKYDCSLQLYFSEQIIC